MSDKEKQSLHKVVNSSKELTIFFNAVYAHLYNVGAFDEK